MASNSVFLGKLRVFSKYTAERDSSNLKLAAGLAPAPGLSRLAPGPEKPPLLRRSPIFWLSRTRKGVRSMRDFGPSVATGTKPQITDLAKALSTARCSSAEPAVAR